MEKIKIGIYFPPEKTDKPIVYRLIKDFDLTFNILNASVSPGKNGRMIFELSGEEDQIKKGLDYLYGQGIEVRQYHDGIIREKDECVNCGACTAVCPSGALWMDPATWELQFDLEKCLLCGHCVKACPTRAIKSFDGILNGG